MGSKIANGGAVVLTRLNLIIYCITVYEKALVKLSMCIFVMSCCMHSIFICFILCFMSIACSTVISSSVDANDQQVSFLISRDLSKGTPEWSNYVKVCLSFTM